MLVYLAGPINGCSDAEANDWRTWMKQKFSDTLDPMRRDYRGREAEAVDEIVELDKADIDACDVFLANCPNPSYGTAMEILYAWQANKPVVVIIPAGSAVSPWITYHSTLVVSTLADAARAIERSDRTHGCTIIDDRYPTCKCGSGVWPCRAGRDRL